MYRAILVGGALCAIGVSLVVVDRFMAGMFHRSLWTSSPHEFRASGVVIDGATNEPVPQAHVIVIAWTTGIKSEKKCFGIIADDDGKFAVTQQTQESLREAMSIIASTPQDSYGEIGSNELSKPANVIARIQGQLIVAENVQLKTSPLPDIWKTKTRYRYSTFAAECPSARITFVGPAWDARDTDSHGN